jgi:glycosyltransferase involved in cell wall biosynthesis
MLRLIVDARCAQYVGSGVPRYCADLIKALSAHTSEFEFLFLIDENLPTTHITFPAGSRLLRTSVAKNSRQRDLWEQFMLPQRLSKNQVDIFHGLDYMIPWTPCRFGRVVTMHDATVFGDHDPRGVLAKMRLQIMIRLAARAADVIITDSDFSANEIQHYVLPSRGKIIRVWPGVSDAFLGEVDETVVQNAMRKAATDREFILYYGGYRKYKNVHLLLNAYSKIASSFPHQLVLVGNTDVVEASCSRLISALGLESRVTIFGYATDTELKALLEKCALFVFPSATEGFGLPVVEAMTCGAPVICSTGGSLPEIAGDAALFMKDFEPESLASVIRLVLTSEVLRQQLISAGTLRSRQFRWGEAARKLIDVYLQVAQQRQTRLIGNK